MGAAAGWGEGGTTGEPVTVADGVAVNSRIYQSRRLGGGDGEMASEG